MKNSLQIFAKTILLFSIFFTLFSAQAQAPQKFSYQAVIRNASSALVANTNVGIRVSILQGSATGTTIYTEKHTPTTNVNGLATLEIGNGNNPSGFFSFIDWSTGSFFIKTETDPTGGTNYTIVGTSQLLSVPFAFNSADNQWIASTSDISNKNLGNVAIGKTSTSIYGHGGTNRVLEIHNPLTFTNSQSQIMLSSGSTQPSGSLGGINYVLPSTTYPEKRMAFIGSEYQFTGGGVNDGGDLSFWTNKQGVLSKKMSITNAGVVSMPFSANTTLDNGGFTKLGLGSPAIKIVKLTGTTSSIAGGFVSINHGLNFAKILSVSVLLSYDATQYIPDSFTLSGGNLFNYYVDINAITILNSATNSSNILSRPLKIMVTYEE